MNRQRADVCGRFRCVLSLQNESQCVRGNMRSRENWIGFRADRLAL